jgi:RNA polymerase sporulation-specific sigma factor
VSLDEPLNVDWDGNELLLSDVLDTGEDGVCEEFAAAEERRMIRRAVASLSPRERQIIELRYGLTGARDLTQKEVADLLGISQSYISRLEKRIIAGLRTKIAGKI